MHIPKVSHNKRDAHVDWLKEVTTIPTAAGREDRVIAWIEQWLSHRKNLELKRDKAGNLMIMHKNKPPATQQPAPIYITAHLDHPAFVVRTVKSETIELEFRGGVHDAYFEGAKIEIVDSNDKSHKAVINKLSAKSKPFKRATATLTRPKKGIVPGDIGRWAFPKPSIDKNNILHTHACDDLAALVAALAVMDVIQKRDGFEHIGLLLTRAEEVGFVGAIAACKLRTVPKSSRLICLENSRSFPESPIGAGPILRVGDRLSVFEPNLTNAMSDIMLAYEKKHPDFKWQRKLMPGGACEATAFATYGYLSTCVCLPLGNYHNMRDIDAVKAGTRKDARVGREFISVDDFHGLVDLLLICCAQLDEQREPVKTRLDKLLDDRGYLVGLK